MADEIIEYNLKLQLLHTFQKCKNELEAVLDAVLLKEFICASNILDRRSEKHMRNHATPNGAF